MTGDSANFADALHSGRFSTAWFWIGPSLDRRTPKIELMAFLWCNSLPVADLTSILKQRIPFSADSLKPLFYSRQAQAWKKRIHFARKKQWFENELHLAGAADLWALVCSTDFLCTVVEFSSNEFLEREMCQIWNLLNFS